MWGMLTFLAWSRFMSCCEPLITVTWQNVVNPVNNQPPPKSQFIYIYICMILYGWRKPSPNGRFGSQGCPFCCHTQVWFAGPPRSHRKHQCCEETNAAVVRIPSPGIPTRRFRCPDGLGLCGRILDGQRFLKRWGSLETGDFRDLRSSNID